MTEEQLKYQNKVKLISFIVLVAGLLLVLLWSIKKNEKPTTPTNNDNNLTISYENNGTQSTYVYTCKNKGCTLASQAGIYALVNDGGYQLINLSSKTTKALTTVPNMAKSFMVASTEFYGLVYTKADTNAATFYEASKDRSLFDDELDFELMNTSDMKNYLVRLYPRGYFYAIKNAVGQIYDINNNTVVVENVNDCVIDGTEIYIVASNGVSSIGQDNSLTNHLANVKRAYAAIYDHKFVVLDNDNNLKLSSIDGETSDLILEVGTRNIQSVTIAGSVLKIVVEDEQYATNQKVHNYEYDFTSKKLKTNE